MYEISHDMGQTWHSPRPAREPRTIVWFSCGAASAVAARLAVASVSFLTSWIRRRAETYRSHRSIAVSFARACQSLLSGSTKKSYRRARGDRSNRVSDSDRVG